QEGYVKYRQVLNLDTTRFFKDTTGITAYLFFQPDRSLYVYNRSKDAETYPSLRERMEQGASELSYGQSDKQGNMIYKDFSGQQLWIRKLVWGKAFRTTEPLPLQ